MTDKKYCYRYVDGNDNQGRPIVILWKNVIIRETEKTFWHCHDYPHMTTEQLLNYSKRPSNKDVMRSLKNAERSRYHYTPEEALRAFIYRKAFQLQRMALKLETVEMCIKGIKDAGFVELNEYGGVTKVISAPGDTFLCADEPGHVAQSFNWGEY